MKSIFWKSLGTHRIAMLAAVIGLLSASAGRADLSRAYACAPSGADTRVCLAKVGAAMRDALQILSGPDFGASIEVWEIEKVDFRTGKLSLVLLGFQDEGKDISLP